MLTVLFCAQGCHAAIEGGVSKTGEANIVMDANTGEPVGGARVSLPKKGFSTVTDGAGGFELGAGIDGQTILSVDKDGYRPYSMTIDQNSALKPVVVGIEKSTPMDIVLDTGLFHLGDDVFSDNSAHSGQFRTKSIGPFYTKTFNITPDAVSRQNHLVIGSIIGVDTLMSRSMGQNRTKFSHSGPVEVFFNGSKISEIHLNGDGQRVKLPASLIRPGNINEVTVKTGRNLMQTAYVDYDDIEIMNLSVQSD